MKRRLTMALSLLAWTWLAAPALAERLEEKTSKSFPAAKVKAVEVVNDAGDITLTGWNKDQIEVTAYKRAQGDSAEKAKGILARIEFKADLSGETLKIEGNLEKLRRFVFFREEAEIDIAIQAPAKLVYSARNGSGEVRAEGMKGRLTINNGSGEVTAKQCEGELNLRTGSGSMELEQLQGIITVQTGSGELRGRELAGKMSFISGSGNIELRRLAPSTFSASTGSGGISAALNKVDQLQELTAKTGSGDIQVRTPKIANAQIMLDTASGDMKCDWCGQGRVHSQGGTTSVETKLGEGRATIRLGAASGDVELLKNSE